MWGLIYVHVLCIDTKLKQKVIFNFCLPLIGGRPTKLQNAPSDSSLIPFRPIRFQHVYLGICFGLYYAAFSLIYWAAGGLGICRLGGVVMFPKQYFSLTLF